MWLPALPGPFLVIRSCGGQFGKGAAVAAVGVKPAELLEELRRQFYAGRIDGGAPVVDLALSADHVQVAARGLGVEDGPAFVLDLLEAALAATLTEGVPRGIVDMFVCHGLDRINQASQGVNPRFLRLAADHLHQDESISMAIRIMVHSWRAARRLSSSSLPGA